MKTQLFARTACFVLALLFSSASLVANAQLRTDDGYYWVTGWTMSPSTLPPVTNAEDAFNNQTLRQVVRVSAAGEQLRLRLSNVHGSKPLHVGAVSIAQQRQGSSADPASLQAVTVSGQQDFVIPRGAVVISDPVDLPVQAFDQLLISLFFPQGTGHATTHRAASQTGYLALGNATQMPDMPTGTEEILFWHFIHAVDVASLSPISTIVTVGDSITDGVGSTADANRRWPDYFAQRLQNEPGMPAFAVANAGLSGNRVLHEDSPNFGENLLARFERDVLALSNVTHMILLEGINDMGMSVSMSPHQEVTAEQIIAGYQQIISRAKARGIKVIGATLTPFEGAGYFSEEGEGKRQTVNDWIRSTDAFDDIIDFEIAVQDPDNPRRIRADFTSDNLHPNDTGYEAMANIIDLGLFRMR